MARSALCTHHAGETGMRMILRFFSSPALLTGIIVSMAVWSLLLLSSGAVKGWHLLDLYTFRAAFVLLFLSFVANSVNSLLPGKIRIWNGLVLAAGALTILSMAYGYLYRVNATIMLAEGEAFQAIPSVITTLEKGPLASIPQLDFSITRIERDGKGGTLEFVQRGITNSLGSVWTQVGDSEIRFKNAEKAPVLALYDKSGDEMERNTIKLGRSAPAEAQWFMLNLLPYDFFIRKENKKGREEYFLNVLRGKLHMYDGPFRQGEKVKVQNVAVVLEGEKRYAIMELRQRRGYLAIAGSAALLALSLGVAVIARMRIAAVPAGAGDSSERRYDVCS